MNKIKVGIVGTGGISNLHMVGYRNLDNVEVYAVCDINKERAEAFAQKYAIPHVFSDYNEMLKLKELDAISVCTWNNGHAPVSIAALNAGKHVLCEKPLAMNTKEALEIQRAARESGKILMVGFVRRFGQNTAILKEFIDKGYLGDIYYAKTGCIRRCGNPGGWFSDKKKSGGGPLIDLGVHMIDLVRFLMGKPKAVSVYGATFDGIGPRSHIKALNRYKPMDYDEFCDVEDLATAMIRFENGGVLYVETSFSQNIKDDFLFLDLYGTKSGAMMEPKLEIYSELEGYLVDITPRYSAESDVFTANFKREVAHFIDCVQGKVECLNPVEDGVEIMKILDAIYESAATHREVILK